MTRVDRERCLVAIGLAVAFSVAPGCAPAAEVKAFDVTPNMVCAHQRVHLTWDVTGRASMSANPPPARWADGAVESQGKKEIEVAQLTELTLTAVDAPLQRSKHAATRQVRVLPSGSSAAQVKCDAATNSIAGQFTLEDVPDDLRVIALSKPAAVGQGHRRDRRVCVGHLDRRDCVDIGQVVKVATLAKGVWELSTALEPGEACDGSVPTQLRIELEYDCGATASH